MNANGFTIVQVHLVAMELSGARNARRSLDYEAMRILGISLTNLLHFEYSLDGVGTWNVGAGKSQLARSQSLELYTNSSTG